MKLSFLTPANCLKQQSTHRLLMKLIFSPNVELYKRWIDSTRLDSTRTYIAEKSNYPAEEAEDGIEEAVNGVVEGVIAGVQQSLHLKTHMINHIKQHLKHTNHVQVSGIYPPPPTSYNT